MELFTEKTRFDSLEKKNKFNFQGRNKFRFYFKHVVYFTLNNFQITLSLNKQLQTMYSTGLHGSHNIPKYMATCLEVFAVYFKKGFFAKMIM